MSAPAEPSRHQSWSSNIAFILAATGAAVGLGNLWRFPYIAGVNGGGAFVLLYILFVFAIGLPIIIGELVIGRRGRRGAVSSVARVAEEAGRSRFWHGIGWLSVVIPFLGLSYYSVVASWSFAYLFRAVTGAFEGLTGTGSEAMFGALTADPAQMVILHAGFTGATILVVARGLHGGIETAAKFLMPGLFVCLLVLVAYAAIAGDFSAGIDFLFAANFSELDGEAVLLALGQAFFSIAVGVGVMITYGAYLSSETSLPRAAGLILATDTFVAILAGIAIFPIVFQFGLNPQEGPGLIFVTLPVAFGQMPFGLVFGSVFFVLLFFAAFTTALGMLEPVVAWLEDNSKASRPALAFRAGFAAWAVGLLSVLSFNELSEFHPLGALVPMTIFELIDFSIANILIIVNGLLIALFAGWMIDRAILTEELALGDGAYFKAWQILIRYVAPLAIIAILASSLS